MPNSSTRARLRMLLPGLASILLAAPAPAPAAVAVAPTVAFLDYWKSGLAELSSYAVDTRRYGEPRRGEGVLVFVYEEIDDRTRIKVETPAIPAARQIPVLKLNNVLKFNTGVYDYSVMTSVFAGLGGPGVSRPFEPRKISFTSQEWCGHVYQHVLPRKEGLVSTIHSYFEAEGDSTRVLPWPRGAVRYEDEMPILVRELDGEILRPGEAMEIRLVPSLWERRKRHVPLGFVKARLAKAPNEVERQTPFGKRRAVRWTLAWEGHSMDYWVEAEKPRRLLAWDDGKGERGELKASLRKTYWERNANQDEPLRRELGLTYGVGAGG